MKRYIALLLTALVTLASCQREELDPVGKVPAGQPVDLVLCFGAKDALSMEIGTKATLDVAAETKVYNMYVYIFGSDGKKIYNHFFDYANRNDSSRPDWWTVNNGDTSTYGELHIHTVSQTSCRMYGISNIDADMVNISPELLATIQTEDELKAMVATLNQNIVSRNGYFPMSGSLDIPDTGNLASLAGAKLALKRLDAKVTFKVKVADGSKIESFTPLKWQVFNVPCDSYIVPNNVDSDKAYFNTAKMNYETKEGSTHGFSFYMQENRKAAKKPVTTYQDRDRKDGDVFVKADPRSTYVVFSGKLEYKDPTKLNSADTLGAVLNAEVNYTVHLGNFSSDVADFRTQRNFAYLYNVTILDVDDIRIEVETAGENFIENEPGAEGIVTIAKEEIFSCDAHYASHVMTFHAANIDPESISWYVKTPFTPDGGSPIVVNGVDITTGLDFEWVEFRINEKNDNGQYFDQRRQVYQPRNPDGYAASVPYKERTMNVSELCQYLKEQAQRKVAGLENDFDNGADDPAGPKICVTAFVNEYYYEKNPLTGAEDPLLWKRFVNQDERRMNILADTKTSVDGKSTIIGAAFTVIQQSIQSIYNENAPDLQTAWGTEHADDEKLENRGWAYMYEPASYDHFSDKGTNRGNTDQYNGRINSMKEWTLVTPAGEWKTGEGLRWDLFLDLVAENTVPYLHDEFKGLRYSCLSRNRDNNGNGKIDPEEVRWYMGATRQLVGIFMGEYGLDNDAVLFQRQAESFNTNNWRQHVLSSTRYSGTDSDNPTELWAEEGISNGPYNTYYGIPDVFPLTTRCLRNLGMESQNTTTRNDPNLSQVLQEVPQDYVVVDPSSSDANGYTFDLSRLNEKSIRYFTSRELDVADQNSLQNCLYRRFQAEPLSSNTKSFSGIEASALNDEISAGLGQNPYCPEGYRLPNQRELSIMLNYIPALSYWNGSPSSEVYPTRSLYSFGPRGTYGSFNKEPNKIFFGANHTALTQVPNLYMVTEGKGRVTSSRCVRDFDGETTGDIMQKMSFQFGDLTGDAFYYKTSTFTVSAIASNKVTVNAVRINGDPVVHTTSAGSVTESISASTTSTMLSIGATSFTVEYDVVYAGRPYTLSHLYTVDVAFPYEQADYYTIALNSNRGRYVYKNNSNQIRIDKNAQASEPTANNYKWRLVKSGNGYKIQNVAGGYATDTPSRQLITNDAGAVYTVEIAAGGFFGLKTAGNTYWNVYNGINNEGIGTYTAFNNDQGSQFYLIPHWN